VQCGAQPVDRPDRDSPDTRHDAPPCFAASRRARFDPPDGCQYPKTVRRGLIAGLIAFGREMNKVFIVFQIDCVLIALWQVNTRTRKGTQAK
jgi:hypothetical protein